jgi:hypothetical protein
MRIFVRDLVTESRGLSLVVFVVIVDIEQALAAA